MLHFFLIGATPARLVCVRDASGWCGWCCVTVSIAPLLCSQSHINLQMKREAMEARAATLEEVTERCRRELVELKEETFQVLRTGRIATGTSWSGSPSPSPSPSFPTIFASTGNSCDNTLCRCCSILALSSGFYFQCGASSFITSLEVLYLLSTNSVFYFPNSSSPHHFLHDSP